MGFFNGMSSNAFTDENSTEKKDFGFMEETEDIEDGYVDSGEDETEEIVETADINDIFLTDDDTLGDNPSVEAEEESDFDFASDEVPVTYNAVPATAKDDINMDFFEPTDDEIEQSKEEESEEEEEPAESTPQPVEETMKGVITDIEKEIKEKIPLNNDNAISFKGGELMLDEPFKFGRVSLTNTKINSEKHPICADEINIISEENNNSIVIGNIVCNTLNVSVTGEGLVGIKGDISAKSINLNGKVLIKGNVKSVSFYLDKGVKINGTVTTAYNVTFDESIFY